MKIQKNLDDFIQSVIDARKAKDAHPDSSIGAEKTKLLCYSSYGHPIS